MKIKESFKKILKYCWPYKKWFLLDWFIAILNSIIVISMPLLSRNLMWKVSNSQTDLNGIISFSFLIIFLLIISAMFNYFINYKGHIIGIDIEKNMRTDIFSHFQNLAPDFFQENKIGELITHVTNDLEHVTEFIHHFPEELLISVLKTFVVIIIMFSINNHLAIVVFILYCLLIASIFMFEKKFRNSILDTKKSIAEINSIVENNLSGMKTVQSFCAQEIEQKKFEKISKKNFDCIKKTIGIWSKSCTIFNTICLGFSPVIVIVGSFMILNRNFNFNDLILFLLYEGIIIGDCFGIIKLVEEFNHAIVGFKRFFNVMSIEPTIKDKNDAYDIKFNGNIEFKDVGFWYTEENKILKNVNFKINSCEYIAIVGRSGEGKSSICNLFLRFWDANQGTILYDGHDIKNIKIKNIRKNIGIVHQDIYLFPESIKENIKYGEKNASEEEIINASKKAHAHEFIMELPQGYDTQIGERGIKLSGGQKQRLAIARVLLKDPKILIFDEATSSLDTESESLIQRSIDELANSRTLIVIAHRLSTIKNANRIFLISEGKLTEENDYLKRF